MRYRRCGIARVADPRRRSTVLWTMNFDRIDELKMMMMTRIRKDKNWNDEDENAKKLMMTSRRMIDQKMSSQNTLTQVRMTQMMNRETRNREMNDREVRAEDRPSRAQSSAQRRTVQE